MDDAQVRVTLGERYRVTTEVRGHTLVLDEPAEVGGDDTGPTPVEAVLAALGACTAMTLRMYAERKGWPLRGVRIALSHRALSRAECLDCPPDAVFPVDRIERAIEVDGDLDEAQLARLLDIANKCPVHRILARAPRIETALRRG